VSGYNRNNAIKTQAGNYIEDYRAVKDKIISAGGLASDYPEGHALHDMVTRNPGYQVHHIIPLSAVNPLFDNTTPQQGKELQGILYSGNHPKNLFVAPSKSHYGDETFVGVHTRLERAGLQPIHRKKEDSLDLSNAHPLIKEIYGSRNAPFEAKVALANRFKNELTPEYHNHLNDALQENEGWANARGKAQAHLAKGELPM